MFWRLAAGQEDTHTKQMMPTAAIAKWGHDVWFIK
jgi:hypothetical protein